MKIIDRETGDSPVLRAGDSIWIKAAIVDGVGIPDGVDESGEEIAYAKVVRA